MSPCQIAPRFGDRSHPFGLYICSVYTWIMVYVSANNLSQMINYVCNVRGGGKRSWSYAGIRKGGNCRPIGGGGDDWCCVGGEKRREWLEPGRK